MKWYGWDITHLKCKYNCLNYWKIDEVLNMLRMVSGLYNYNPEGRGAFVSTMWVADVLKECGVAYKPAYFIFGEARGDSIFYYWKCLDQLNYDQITHLLNYIKDAGWNKTFIYEIAGFETGGGL